MDLRRLIRNLIHNESAKIAEHNVHDVAHACHCSADSQTRNARFRDGCVKDALRAELFNETGQYLEGCSRFGNVLTQHEHSWVAAQFFCQRFSDRVTES